MKIYTRRGDQGETDLLGGPRVAKDDPRVEAYGSVDELNACLGVCAAATGQPELRQLLERIQAELFELGAYLASTDPERRHVAAPDAAQVAGLEREIDRLEKELPPLRRFVLPGGSAAAAAFHVARTVCRRAERAAVTLGRAQALEPSALEYLNRLSDLLFVLARVENQRAGVVDSEWSGRERG